MDISYRYSRNYSLLFDVSEYCPQKSEIDEKKRVLGIKTNEKHDEKLKNRMEVQISHIKMIECLEYVPKDKFISKSIKNTANFMRGFINKKTIIRGANKNWDSNRLLLGKHENFKKIGCEHIILTTKFGDKIDAIYLESVTLADKIGSYGGKKCVFSIDVLSENAGNIKKNIPGYYFNKFSEDLKDCFFNLGFETINWIFIVDDNDACYLVRYSDSEELNNAISEGIKIEMFETAPVDSHGRGTVILTMNQTDIYEQYGAEILTFALEGINVISYNNGGKGLSKGSCTEEAINEAIEAVYQYVRYVKLVPDHKILAKGQCFGGAPTAWLGSQHQEINLMLDQTPANFIETSIQFKNKYIQEKKLPSFVKSFFRSKFVDTIISKSMSKYNLEVFLKENRGKQLIHINIPNEEGSGGDHLVPEDHPEKLLYNCSEPTMTRNPGGVHVTDWFLEPNNFKRIMQFMEENNLTTDLYEKTSKNLKID